MTTPAPTHHPNLTGPLILKNPWPETSNPGIQISINNAEFQNNIGDFLDRNQDFGHYTNGQPTSMLTAWKDIQSLRDHILHATDPHTAEFRRRLVNLIKLIKKPITKAVCAGLGAWFGYTNATRRDKWTHQCGMFLAICILIERRQKGKMQKVFADPEFTPGNIYFIQNIMAEEVVRNAFGDVVDETSFVYGIHLPQSAVANGVLTPGKHPELYIGNRIAGRDTGVAGYIASEYIKLAHLSKDTSIPAELTAIIEQVYLIHETHALYSMKYDYASTLTGDVVPESIFCNTWAYVRMEKPRAIKKAAPDHVKKVVASGSKLEEGTSKKSETGGKEPTPLVRLPERSK